MGLRKPSGWQTFTAQAYAGAGQQQKAREEMKEPGKTKQAFGGMGSVGTSMVAATTGAQQAATKQVQETTTQASKELQVDPNKVGTATVTAIGGTATPVKADDGTEAKTESGATKNVYTGGMSTITPGKYTETDAKNASDALAAAIAAHDANKGFNRTDTANKVKEAQAKYDEIVAALGGGDIMTIADSGNVDRVEAVGTAIQNAITDIDNQINAIDQQLKTANAQDAQKLQAEKDRLNKKLEEYRKKLSDENLGKIADQSTFETEMEERERVLAEKGDNVGKLATLFGRRGVSNKALASQIYGKDLENIQKAAAQGLISKEQAEQAAAEAETQYSKQLDTSKEGFEKTFETEDRKLELLSMSPEELKGVTQEEAEKLFGKEMAERLFDFKDGYVSDSQTSLTRKALEDRRTKLKEQSGKIENAKTKAKDVTVKNLSDKYFPVDEYGAAKPSIIEQELAKLTTLPERVSRTSESGPFGMFSRTVEHNTGGMRQEIINKYSDQIAAVENNLRNAVDRGDTKEAERIAGQMGQLRLEIDQQILKYKQLLRDQGYK